MNIDDLSGDAISVLVRYRDYKWPITKTLCHAIYDYLADDRPFTINHQEISPLEMLAIVYELLASHNSEKESVQ